MNTRDIVRRLHAFDAGAPIPCGETRHFHMANDEDILIVAFVRMGGESRPWGIAYGHPGEEPTVLSVPEGRNRDLVAGMCVRFAPYLLQHLRAPEYAEAAPAEWTDLRPLRQIWVPNPGHLDMLHHLAYAYALTKWGDDKRELLNGLGRACGWLFRESQRAGEQHVFAATHALTDSYAFPAQDIRQQHLGFLLAWLDPTGGDREARWQDATTAERESVSTSLSPELERATEDRVDRWRDANRAGDEAAMSRLAGEVADLLKPELERRFRLTAEAIGVLREDERRVNTGVMELVDAGLQEQWYQHTRIELRINSDDDGPAFVPSPETDRSPAAAGSRYQVHLSSAELKESALLHDDRELQAEAIASGDAFKGTVVAVCDESPGPSRKPIWTVSDPVGELQQLRLRPGSWVCVVGMPSRVATIRQIQNLPDGSREYELEIINGKTRPDDACDPSHVGSTVTFVSSSAHGLARRKSMLIWNDDGPGAWLTHRRPSGLRMRVAPEAAEDVILRADSEND